MITTKRGDGGETDCGGKRLDKDNILVETVGEIDELQAVLELIDGDKYLVKDLGVIMGEIGSIKKNQTSNIKPLIKRMEKEIEKNEKRLTKFIIFKTEKAKELNWARTVCRRVERKVVTLSKTQTIDKELLQYFNRLSDYLFVLALKNNK